MCKIGNNDVRGAVDPIPFPRGKGLTLGGKIILENGGSGKV